MNIEAFFPLLFSGNDFQRTKGKTMIYIILMSIIICICLWTLNFIGIISSDFSYMRTILISIVLLVIFRLTNSTQITANLFILVLAYFICKLSLHSGGIYSDDTFFLGVLPVIAYILSEVRSAIFWFVAVNLWTYYLFSLTSSPEQIQFFRDQSLSFPPNYYFVFCLVNSGVLLIMISIFYFHNIKLIKKLKQNKQDLERRNHEYHQQTKTLEETQKRLKYSNIELEQYAYATSHDLKQPIRTINSFASLLKKDLNHQEVLDERNTKVIDQIIKSSNGMLQLVEDLLVYAKLSATANKLPLQKLPLDEVLDNVLRDLHNQICSNQVTIEREQLPTLEVVPTKINQIFQNIISNAIKFKKKDEPLTIKILSQDNGDHWELAVEDNGIGIEKEHQEKIFAPFQKLHNENEYAGSGIGLATCKRIVDMHKGKIWVESQKNKGTKFVFTLPQGQRN